MPLYTPCVQRNGFCLTRGCYVRTNKIGLDFALELRTILTMVNVAWPPRTATKFCLDNGALRDFDDPPVSAAVRGAAAPAGNNKQANSSSPRRRFT